MQNKTRQGGITLVEIAIVLVVLGLLLGGILKGQELINNAKIRAIADRQNSLKTAWYAFIDRYQDIPGDFAFAAEAIPGAGNGNGDGNMAEEESALAFQHLTGAGYLRCPQCTAAAPALPSAKNSLQNNYGGIMSAHTTTNFAFRGGGGNSGHGILSIQTGGRIPSNIIAEVDRKVDDGIANTGDFVFSNYNAAAAGGNALAPAFAECMSKTLGTHTDATALFHSDYLHWRPASAEVEANCGGAIFI